MNKSTSKHEESWMTEFSKKFSVSEKDKKLLFDFYRAYDKANNSLQNFLPKHLFQHFRWLIEWQPSFCLGYAHELPELLQASAEGEKAIYNANSIVKEFYNGRCLYRNITIHWIYADVRDKPLVNYQDNINNYDYLNHWGLISAIQLIDEAFSEWEVESVKAYLENVYEGRMKTTIKKCKLPTSVIMPIGFMPEELEYSRIDLHKEKGYYLPFRVQGVFDGAIAKKIHRGKYFPGFTIL